MMTLIPPPWRTIRSIPHVAGVEFISKDQMLDEYSQRLEGYTNLKEMFQNDNPLPAKLCGACR